MVMGFEMLQALDKLARDHGPDLMREGALLAVLQNIDFFEESIQRLAAHAAANLCRSLSSQHHDAVREAVPKLANLLSYQVGF